MIIINQVIATTDNLSYSHSIETKRDAADGTTCRAQQDAGLLL
jgi:hypothetical protein